MKDDQNKEIDFVEDNKKRKYSITPKVKEQRKNAAITKHTDFRELTNYLLAGKLQKFVKEITDEEIEKASLKDKVVAVGILYDKLYRDKTNTAPVQAVQINIKAPEGQPPLDLRIGVPTEEGNAS